MPAPTQIIYEFSYGGVRIDIHFVNEHPPPHFHVDLEDWDEERRYTYPYLEPVPPTEAPLTNREEERILEAIDEYDSFEEEFNRHRGIVEDNIDPVTGVTMP